MYRMLPLLALLGLAACGHKTVAGCPALEPLLKNDPGKDARAAFASGDKSLLMIGGYTGTIPGAEGSKAMSRPLQGASETETPGCVALHDQAVRYATIYNIQMLEILARSKS